MTENADLPIEQIPLRALAHVITLTKAAKLEHLINTWDSAKLTPIEIIIGDSDGLFWPRGGNHRLSACRNLGLRTIPARVHPSPAGTPRLTEAAVEDGSRLVQLRIAPATERQIADMLPAVAAWARENNLAEITAEGDVIALAVELMHQQVFAKLTDIMGAARPGLGTEH